MLMADDKKKSVAMIISKIGKKPENMSEVPNENGAEQDDSIGAESAAEELLAAIESKSAKGVVEAIKALMEFCEAPESSEVENSEKE